jgi:hypothetical protein
VDQYRFAAVTRSLTELPSRRDVLRGLAGIGLGMTRLPLLASATKRTQSEAAPKPNKYGCLEIGDPCKRAGQCCSGICKRKNGKKKCRAHGTGTCDQQKPGVCTATFLDPEIFDCNFRSGKCSCYATTAGSKYCAALGTSSRCADCKKDTDCEKLGYPPGSACVPFAKGRCAGFCETGMACAVPCGYEPPES